MAVDDFIQKLMVGGQLDWQNGVLRLAGLRGVLLPAPTFAKLLISSNKNIDKVLDAMFEAGKFHGLELVVKGYGEQLFKMPKETLINQWGASGSVMGLGGWEWTEFNPETKIMRFTLSNSTIVEEFKKNKIKTKRGVDTLMLGILAGLGEGCFQTKVTAEEVRCALHGAPACEFLVKGVSKSTKQQTKKTKKKK